MESAASVKPLVALDNFENQKRASWWHAIAPGEPLLAAQPEVIQLCDVFRTFDSHICVRFEGTSFAGVTYQVQWEETDRFVQGTYVVDSSVWIDHISRRLHRVVVTPGAWAK